MRFFLRVLLLTLIVVTVFAAFAPAPPAALAQSEVRRTRYNPRVDDYTVKEGDTLWGITDKIVGSPWMWPKVWSYNPEIANPNWIYPGDVIYFYRRDFSFPSLYDRPELASRSIELERDVVDETSDGGGIQVIQRPVTRRKSARLFNMFITEDQLQEAGTLVNAANDDILLSQYDTVYLEFPEDKLPKRGDEFMVYRTVKEVRHPVRGGRVGYITEVTGFARVNVPRDDGIVSAEITKAVLEIDRGQLVTPKTRDLRYNIPSKKAATPVDGFVVALHSGWGVVGSEQQLAFIDVGTEAGIEVGNEFVVFRESDRYRDSGRGNDLPLRPIGLLRVAEVHEEGATVLVVDSLEEIEVGQKIRAVTE
ncbi:MAG: LysM peptidoglycan-binding domain-containing protein [Myxococcota bacterium]